MSIKLEIDYTHISRSDDCPAWLDTEHLAVFLHHKMDPYHDTLEDVRAGIAFALAEEPDRNGFIIVASAEQRIVGAIVMLRTSMRGYIPGNILLFVCVDPEVRGRGIGKTLIERAASLCQGPIKLHVEPDNPALRLYERIGFKNKYLEMRYSNS